ncbi:MAG: bifunctional YncE family protein/alkaline phosphatase family protein [Candidatus Aquilonibacter sp.]
MNRQKILVFSLVLACAALGAVATRTIWLPTDWALTPAAGDVSTTGTMPQGLALSPDDSKIAVVESGVNPPALRILDTRDLHPLRVVPLKDAFGTPVWTDNAHVLVPGATTNAVLLIDVGTGTVSAQPATSYISAVARASDGTIYATSDLDNQLVRVGSTSAPLSTGAHPAAIVFAGARMYVANRGESTLSKFPGAQRIAVDLHPAALALSPDGLKLYVACSDADTIDVVDTKTGAVIARIDVGVPQGHGASPNALAVASDGTLYASLGAQNAVAEIRGDHVIARAPAGWYPTGVTVDDHNVYISNGRGEGSRANPDFRPEHHHDPQYVGSAMSGSVRSIERDAFDANSTAQVLANMPVPVATPAQTVVRAHGPIAHVIYIIKENRTYDQVLGDLPIGDGDPNLAWFGKTITPNDHAIALRFGVFDRTFTDAQVSANGHNWSTAAFANDYLERFWPPNYGGRRKQYDFEDGATASEPGTGYIWDDAGKHGVSLRDYGEFVTDPSNPGGLYTTHMAGLIGKIDGRFPGFDLKISDEFRVDEWQREFTEFERNGNLPALTILRLPNDHTSGTYPGALTPQAYVAQNDHALGRVVDIVSHSRYWASTAIFAIEDDSQNGPDHVDDQRTTFYLASAYAAPGVHHAQYTTSSVVRTIELLLGLPPMTIYDALAPPMYDAFALQPDLRPYDVIAPQIDDTVKNTRTAYGAAQSERMDFRDADAADPRALNDILAHVAGHVPRR